MKNSVDDTDQIAPIETMQFDTSLHCLLIGVGRFRLLGGQGIKYWGAKGGPNSQQAHDVILTSM